MKSKQPFRKLLLLFFVICTILRLVFVFAAEQIPVMWDARIYSSAAIGLIYYFDKGGSFGHPESLTTEDHINARRHVFLSKMEHYIKGERIEWLYYSIPSTEEAQEYVFISGPIYPLYLAAVFITDFATDFTIVRVLNCIIDGFCVVLLMLIALKLFCRRTAILAGIVYIIYLPFFLLSGLVSPDQLTILFILLTLYLLLQWYDKQANKYLYSVGALLGLLVLIRPTATLLFVPFLLGYLHDHKSDIIGALKYVARAAIPFAVIVIPWVIISSLYFDELAIRDPNYSAANFRSSSSIEYEGYDLDYVKKDFWTKSVPGEIASDPLGYAGLLISKFHRLWSRPYNDFDRSFVITPAISRLIHHIIVLFGLFGVFFFAVRKGKGLIYLFHIPFYYTLIHIVLHSLARYNLNPMPFIIIASAGAMIAAYDFIKQHVIDNRDIRRMSMIALCLAGVIVIAFLPESIGASFLGGTLGVIMIISIKVIIILAIFSYASLIPVKSGTTRRSIKLLGIPASVLIIVLIVVSGARDRWAEWECKIDSPDQVAGVRIFIPDDFRLEELELARIGIDIVTNKNPVNSFYIVINGQRFAQHVLQPPISDFYLRKLTYKVFEQQHDMGKEEMRLWRKMSLESEVFNQLADRFGVIDIAVMTIDSLPEENKFIKLYGGHEAVSGSDVYIPSLTETSIERFVEKGDTRIWKNYHLSSDSALSYYIADLKDGSFREDDLSTLSGRQSGRYRIFIEVKKLDGKRYYF